MTVQELIDELEKVKNKNSPVTAPNDAICSFVGVIGVGENEGEVFLELDEEPWKYKP